jgi:molybdopterin-guanine dinucleotide biosynthesis protein A
MGTDKATLWWQGNYLVLHTIGMLREFKLDLILSVNPGQYSFYQHLFPSMSIIPDHPDIPYEGPVKGVLSVHRNYSTEDLLVIACDLPQITQGLVQKLMLSSQSDKGFEVYLYSIDGQYEPLLGIYTSEALQTLDRPGDKKPQSGMRYLLQKLKVHSIALDEQERVQFKNFNSISDLNADR